MILKALWLDTRLNASPPIADSVHIPLAELEFRVHELPPRHETIWIAKTGPFALEACAWLNANGRIAKAEDGFEYGDSAGGRLWAPNPFLEHCLNGIPPGKALDIACGSGRDAVYMASCGFRVTAIDHLQEALEMGKDLERRYLANCEPISWVRTDIEKTPPQGQFDLVTCFHYLHRPILAHISDLLAPGGKLVFETFTSVHREKHGKPRTENFVLQPSELKDLVKNLSLVEYEEDWHDSRHTARIWAVKG